MRAVTDVPDKLHEFTTENIWHLERGCTKSPGEIVLEKALGLREPVWEGGFPDPGCPSFWNQVLIAGSADSSQFDTLRKVLGGGLRLQGPTACAALEGRNFHGHRGHSWMAAAGNLHLSIAIQPERLHTRNRAALTVLPAVAVVNAVRTLCGRAVMPGIKWVNDILADGRKLAGVITSTQVMGDRFTQVLFGIGLNVAVAPPVPPSPFVSGAVSLADLGPAPSFAAVLSRVMQQIEQEFANLEQAGPGRLLKAYRELSLVVGREVVIWPESVGDATGSDPVPPIARGRVLEIQPDLSLILEGSDDPVAKGRLAFADRCPPILGWK